MQIGSHLPQYGRVAGPDAITRAAVHAESLGFADLWVSDHVVHPAAQSYPSPYLFDPLLTLTYAAAATTRIGLGTSVLVVPQHNPLWLANALASTTASTTSEFFRSPRTRSRSGSAARASGRIGAA